jgi:hypothetical protein
MLKTLKVSIRGVAPLLMHNGQLADPLCPWVKAMKKITNKQAKKKTDADHEELARLEFMGGLYVGDNGPILTGETLEGVIRDGARVERKGKDVVAGVWCDSADLEYDGPRDPDELWGDKRFVHRCSVVVGRARVMRTRPRFKQWAASFPLSFDDELIDESVVRDAIEAGGRKGACDWRPKYGRFEVLAVK